MANECHGNEEKVWLHSDSTDDVATCSNFREVRVTNLHLDLSISFLEKSVTGVAVLDCKILKETNKVILDIHPSLLVSQVCVKTTAGGETQDANFETKSFTDYGTGLHIKSSTVFSPGQTFQVTITYKATNGPGICWLEPVQTAGKAKPYMYTQGQSVLNRSFFPCQDTPAVKCPYSANIKVPEGFTAVMSASESSFGEVPSLNGDKQTFYFRLKQPIPSYLVALAVGDLQCEKIGPRSYVWTEPCMLEKAKAEFDGVVEDFISTGEQLFGPYVWGKYDILVMPPSFPYGGMENPCLTFVTPCLLVGDKSLTDVVIHEIAHSWFGNLITNANWGEFWLNEGFTMYGQRRIMNKLFGEEYTCLETATGCALLRQHMENTGMDHPLNKLRVVIEEGVDPDDTYCETPYEKGFAFVSYLQHLSGSVEGFDDFLKAYVKKYQFKSLVAEDMLGFFLDYFPKLKEKNEANRDGCGFHSWLHMAGWPTYVPDLAPGETLTKPAELLAAKWAGAEEANIEVDNIQNWKTYQILHFLDKLLEKEQLPLGTLQKMVETYPFIVNTHNAEIRLRWSQLTIKHDFQDDFNKVKSFLRSQGKQKYTLPIYRALKKGSEKAQQLAMEIFEETKDQLHVNVRNYVQKIIQ